MKALLIGLLEGSVEMAILLLLVLTTMRFFKRWTGKEVFGIIMAGVILLAWVEVSIRIQDSVPILGTKMCRRGWSSAPLIMMGSWYVRKWLRERPADI